MRHNNNKLITPEHLKKKNRLKHTTTEQQMTAK